MAFFGSPSVSTQFIRQPTDQIEDDIVAVRCRANQKSDCGLHEVSFLIQELNTSLSSVNHGQIKDVEIDELQHLIDNDPKTRSCLSSWILEQLGDVATMQPCLIQLEMAFPTCD